MPELPEVETVRRSLEPHLVGRRICDVQVREPRLRSVVDGTRLRAQLRQRGVVALRRRAKYLLADLDDDRVLLIHLGMTGRLLVVPAEHPTGRHDHIIWQLDNGKQLRFNDARRFGMVETLARDQEADHPRLRRLGIEPLSPAFTGGRLLELASGRRQPIKPFLMDAARVVGVGNIYACEALFRARIHPGRPAGTLSRPRCDRLADGVKQTLLEAIDQGGTTLRDFVDATGSAGGFAVRLAVYGRQGQPCPSCGTPLRRMVQSGRSAFYCGRCQR